MKKRDVFVSFIKGIITGFASLVPGVSTAAVVLSVSVYEKVIESFHNLSKKDNKALLFVTIPLFIGVLVGLFGGMQLVSYLWDKFKVQTLLLFAGLVLGGIRVVSKKEKIEFNNKKIIFFIFVSLLFGGLYYLLKDITILSKTSTISSVCLLSLITGVSLLIPGSSLITMKLSKNYKYLFGLVKKLSGFSVVRIIVFILILILTVSVLAKTMYKLIDKHKDQVYIVLCSLMFASIVVSLLQIDKFTFNFVNIFTSLIALLWGYIFAKNVERE